MPAGIVRPSIVYGTYKHPEGGWVGSANNGHIGFLAGYTKGLFRTMTGSEKSILGGFYEVKRGGVNLLIIK
jgi:hypothetical protein